MTDGCNGCGRCCDPVPLPYTQQQVAAMLPAQISGGKADRDFILHSLRPISRREGLERAWFKQGGKTAFASDPRDPATAQVLLTFFYECVHFDRETRQCTNYENRPPMCSGYPWYEGPPDPMVALPPECGYNADVGRPVHVHVRTESP